MFHLQQINLVLFKGSQMKTVYLNRGGSGMPSCVCQNLLVFTNTLCLQFPFPGSQGGCNLRLLPDRHNVELDNELFVHLLTQ